MLDFTTNVRRLTLEHVSIDVGLVKTILAMPNLSHLALLWCTSKFRASQLTELHCPPSQLQHFTIKPYMRSPEDMEEVVEEEVDILNILKECVGIVEAKDM